MEGCGGGGRAAIWGGGGVELGFNPDTSVTLLGGRRAGGSSLRSAIKLLVLRSAGREEAGGIAGGATSGPGGGLNEPWAEAGVALDMVEPGAGY